MFVRGFRDYLVSYIRALGLENPVLTKSYIRRVLATGYGTINFTRFLKGSRATGACILNIKSIKKIREHFLVNLRKEGRNNFFSKTKKIESI